MRSRQKYLVERAWLVSLASAGGLALFLSSSAFAQKPGPPPSLGKGAFGKISAVRKTSLTVQFREGGSATFTASASTPVTLDGKTVALSALAAGEFAAISSFALAVAMHTAYHLGAIRQMLLVTGSGTLIHLDG